MSCCLLLCGLSVSNHLCCQECSWICCSALLQVMLLFVSNTAMLLFVCSLYVCLSFILFVWLDEMCCF
ncbi:hypothetical protein HanRHA438_Chr01g0022331 [Helianthus annuus]|nr:hypothetical protein HanRHA438_Chr01g0022331 [Helianthus annuus]